MNGLLITFEGTEGSGKSTQIQRLAVRLRTAGLPVRTLREPGGTEIGEEIRHTLQHSAVNQAMTPEAELLLINASRAQLVRQVLRPALAAGEIVLLDRYYDSTTAYQGYGRELDLVLVREVIRLAIDGLHPDVTLLLRIPVALSEQRRRSRSAGTQSTGSAPADPARDRMEEAGRAFFERVERGYDRIAAEEPDRIRVINAFQSAEVVGGSIWEAVAPLLHRSGYRVP
jgi:dTMP kinase